MPGLPALQNNALNPFLAVPTDSYISYHIEIVNITGSIVKTATTPLKSWQDNVSDLAPGTYIIKVINNYDKSLVGKSTFVKM